MQKRRIEHEQRAAAQRSETEPGQGADTGAWNSLEPAIDDAMAQLTEADRSVLVLRYFQDKSVAEAAAEIGISFEAAKKRLTRALEKLRARLSSAGVTLSAAAVVAGLEAQSASAAPAHLLAHSASVATGGAGVSGSMAPAIAKGAIFMMTVTKASTIAIAAGILLLAGAVGVVIATQYKGRAAPVSSVSTSASTSAPAFADFAGGFTPLVERIVYDDSVRHDDCIDLDTGKTLDPSRGFRDRADGRKWFRDTGADCHAETQEGEAGLYIMAGAQIALRADEFDTISADAAKKQMADLPDHEDLMSADVELPATYLFKTRDGAIGVLKITEVQREAPAHLKIRYKLVAGSSTQPAPSR